MKINFKYHILIKDFMIISLLSIILSYISLFIIFDDVQIYSDNVYYKNAFQSFITNNIAESYKNFIWNVGATEPISFLIFYLFSFFTTYIVFLFLLSFIMYFLFFIFFKRMGVNYLNTVILLGSNYYITVMIIGIHRLEIAFIFLILYLLSSKSIYKIFFFIIAPLTHFQIILFYFIYMSSGFISNLILLKLNKKLILVSIFMSIMVFILIYYTGIYQKFVGRIHFYPAASFYGFLISIVFILFFKIKDIKIITIFLVIVFFIFLIGSFRMNMVLYLYMFFISAIKGQKSGLAFNYLMMPYLFYKTIHLYNVHYIENLIPK